MLCIYECKRVPLLDLNGGQVLDSSGRPKYRTAVGTAGDCQGQIESRVGRVQRGVDFSVTRENCLSFHSSRAADVVLSDFPEGHSFGNGVSIGAVAVLRGEKRRLNWVVMSEDAGLALSNIENMETLRAIMEGEL